MLSMPPGTPAKGVLEAARNFAREEFALKHRYALVLHTDEPHPHVHLVVKAVSEQGERLNIRKANLREWRREFARHIREQGIGANATERAVRGEPRKAKKDGIYRASERGESTYLRAQAGAVAIELLNEHSRVESGKRKLLQTRREIEAGWRSVSTLLDSTGHHALANDVMTFVDRMLSARTDRELISDELQRRAREPHVREHRPSR
jgi:hypothetical protein